MNSLEPSQTFEAARRQHLIDATIEALADVGFKATSLSQIARRADVSTGLFAHYFGDKDGLLEATLRFMAARLVRATRQRLRAATTPRQRLYAVPDSALADQEFERRTSAVWLAFWGQITHSIRYQRIQRIYQRRMLSNLRHDLRELVPAPCVDDYATMIASMIDGVWIRSHAAATRADGAQARAIVRALIDGLIAGAATAPREPTHPPSGPLPICVAVAGFPGHHSDTVSAGGDGKQKGLAARQEAIDAAIATARRGLETWRLMSGYGREKALRRCADLIRLEGQHFARLDAQSTGRAVAQTIEGCVPRAARAFERMSALPSQAINVRVALGAGAFGDTRREPLGIVPGFGHWSSPLLDASQQAAAALACGNAMIFLPSTLSASSARHLADIMARAGVPGDAFTILDGDAETAQLLLSHPELTPAAPRAPAAGGFMRAPRPKAATIIFADADMDRAVNAVLHGCRRWTPTPDLSETLIFVQKSGLPAVRSRLLAGVAALRGGDPLDPATQIGPLVSAAHLQRVLDWIADAVRAGATLLTGGHATYDGASALEPTVLEGCTSAMAVARHSAFAPIVTIFAFESDDDITRLTTNRELGAVGIFCAESKHGQQIANQLRRAFCCINDFTLSAGTEDCLFDSFDAAMLAGIYSRPTRIFTQGQDASGGARSGG